MAVPDEVPSSCATCAIAGTARIVTRRPSKRSRKASPPECDQKHSSRSNSPSIEKPRQTSFLRAKTKFLREQITFGFNDRIRRRGRYNNAARSCPVTERLPDNIAIIVLGLAGAALGRKLQAAL